MFQVDLAEHVRLSYESLEGACEAHVDAASRLARVSSWFRMLTLAVVGAGAGVAAMGVNGGRGWHVAAAIVTAVAFATCAAYVAFNQQPRIYGHRASAARLWVVCEKYRSLLAEMHEGMLDLAALGTRRNALLQEAATIFEQVAPHDRYTFEIARRALKGRAAAPTTPPPPAAPPAPVGTA